MYLLLLLGLLGLGGWILRSGFARRSRSRVTAGALVVAATLLFFLMLWFWGEMFWFEAAGYSPRFWRMVAARVGTVTLFATVAGAVAGLLGGPLLGITRRKLRRSVQLAGGVAGALVGLASWDEFLLFLNRVETGVNEPVLGLDTGFYLFVLPLLNRAFALLVIVTLGAVGAAVLAVVVPQQESVIQLRSQTIAMRLSLFARPLRRASLPLAVVGALGMLLARYHLLY